MIPIKGKKHSNKCVWQRVFEKCLPQKKKCVWQSVFQQCHKNTFQNFIHSCKKNAFLTANEKIKTSNLVKPIYK